MMRARWALAGFALVLATGSFAGANDAEIKASTAALDLENQPYGEMLHRYLIEQAGRLFEARRQAIAGLKTPEDIGRRQQELRAFFLRSLGDFPERSRLSPFVVGSLPGGGYHIEKVIFESRPSHHVTALLYIPEGKPPFPGVLVPCGHSDNGKAYIDYQRACILLAKNGMVALCYDPIGQGERFQFLDAKGKPVVRGTTEHTMAGIGALLIGRQLASYRIWDGLRALDYLAGRPEVDPNRLGCTGNSGGGTITSYLMALDDRIAVAAPSCYITSLERLFATIGPQDAEQNITGQVAAGMEHADYLTLRAPKPTLLTVGTRDFFDIQGSWNTFREVKLIYGRLGFGERVDLFESDEEHGFTRVRRVATARWMRRWLLKRDDAVDEPHVPLPTDAELQCTPSGQVLTDFKDGVSVFDLNRQRAHDLKAAREAADAQITKEAFRSKVRKTLGLDNGKVRPIRPRVGETANGRTLAFEVERDLILPALELPADPESTRGGPVLVKIGADWEQEIAQRKASAQRGSTYSRTVLVDPRGLGRTSPSATRSDQRNSPFGRDWKEAYIALHIGRPLLGQRVADLLSILEGLDAEAGEKEHNGFHVVGIGAAGPVVLHAAALDEHGLIKHVTVERSLASWSDVVERGVSRDQLGNVVPGVLEVYDLPDLTARLAPLPLTIRQAVDAMGQPISQEVLERTYARALNSYGTKGTLQLQTGP